MVRTSVSHSRPAELHRMRLAGGPLGPGVQNRRDRNCLKRRNNLRLTSSIQEPSVIPLKARSAGMLENER